MSIWCPWEEVGYDTEVGEPTTASRGEVRSYAEGFSNHYPDDQIERPSSINVAHIPRWCVPGHRDDSDEDYCDGAPVGDWCRLDVTTWDGNYKDPKGPWCHSVVLDETAARSLAADLLAWAEREKVHPEFAPRADA
jgi:hypothetical protein